MFLLLILVAACGNDIAATPTALTQPADNAAIVNLPQNSGAVPTATQIIAASSQNPGGQNQVGALPPLVTPKPVVAPTNTAMPTATPYPTPALKIPQVGTPLPVEFKGKGQVTERQFNSSLLGRNISYRIYLPAEYANSPKRYPVLYMLHGFSGKVDEWMWYGLFGRLEDLINTGQIQPLIIVLPFGDQEYWVDHPNNGLKWGEYIAHEVVDHIDGNFRTIPLKQSRGIGGLSMGGNGALQLAMNFPNIFGVVGAHSPTMRTYESRLPWMEGQTWFALHDPVEMAKTNNYITQVKLWIDDGTEDELWRPRALELKKVLLDRKIAFTWKDFPGQHDAEYWTDHVLDYLSFYGSSLAFK